MLKPFNSSSNQLPKIGPNSQNCKAYWAPLIANYYPTDENSFNPKHRRVNLGHRGILIRSILTRFCCRKRVIITKTDRQVESVAFSQVGVHISFLKHNSATVRNILMVHGRIILKVNADGQLCLSSFSDYFT